MAEMRSPNVSVTPINVEHAAYPAAGVFFNGSAPGADMTPTLDRDREHGDSGSDAEVAQIDFQRVNMRTEKKLDVPRPMSWEGELSDGGADADMCIDDDSHNPQNLSTSKPLPPVQDSPILRLKQPSGPPNSYSLHSTPGSSPLLGQRHSIPVLHKALNVPATPSPDSAIHSAYSVFSSPSQSPLTQRHVTLTPSLSRNNSDASHSSCCSYSSVSVSVSPTQQFSPTHSPVQGRHVHQLHGSPLHHNVIYRNIQEVAEHSAIYVRQQQQQVLAAAAAGTGDQELANNAPGEHEAATLLGQQDEQEDKTGIAHALPAGPGISRQQLINRHVHQLHGSPLHHNVIYRNIQEVAEHSAIYVRQQQQQVLAAAAAGTGDQELANNAPGEHEAATLLGQQDEQEDKTGIAHALPAGPGISRQQLINRHVHQLHGSPLHHNVIYRNIQEVAEHSAIYVRQQQQQVLAAAAAGAGDQELANNAPGEHEAATLLGQQDEQEDKTGIAHALPAGPGISRQQLINSPCPICGDKISGFHYGIFSCESCKGFFKRTVQNRKNYVCLRGAICPVTVATRKKCPACRFDKCLQCGMKLEAIREDRTRGGRSTYQCSYTLPASLMAHPELRASSTDLRQTMIGDHAPAIKLEPNDPASLLAGIQRKQGSGTPPRHSVPPLLQEIMDVEHLWHYTDGELTKLHQTSTGSGNMNKSPGSNNASAGISLSTHPLLANTGLASSADTNPDFVANLCNIADHRLYKIVKWCKSLPLFKNISIDDQICLLINSWCELLLFSCCFRSMSTPGEIRVSLGKSINLAQARDMGLQACIERMLNFTDHLRRLRVDRYEYVAMKVIVLLTSDTSELREAEKVRASQEKALQALQGYTLTHYPDIPAKFGELLLRIPELQRTCQVGKEMLTIKSKEGEGPSFNLLMELLRGDH